MKTRKKIASYTAEELKGALKEALSITDFIRALGLKPGNGTYETVRALAELHDLELPHWSDRPVSSYDLRESSREKINNKEFFVKGKKRNSSSIKKRMLRDLGFKNECSMSRCKVKGTWLGANITLQVDHINGDKFDNRVVNLRLLCPNCHSQTETFGYKNRTKTELCGCGRRRSVSKDKSKRECPHGENVNRMKKCSDCGEAQILKRSKRCRDCEVKARLREGRTGRKISYPEASIMVKEIEEKGYTRYSTELGVSDNAVRKHLKRQGVSPLPKRKKRKNCNY